MRFISTIFLIAIFGVITFQVASNRGSCGSGGCGITALLTQGMGGTANAAMPAFATSSIDGLPLSKDSLAGQVVVANFWATWCPPCVEGIPSYIALQEEFSSRGVRFIGFSVDDGGSEKVAAFGEARGINYPLVMADRAL